jgi:hypothetical protein
MALKKPNSAPSTPAAAFEQEPSSSGDTAVLETPVIAAAAAPATPAAAAAATAGVQASTAVAKAAASSVGAVNEAAATARQFKKDVEAMKGAADFSFGSHRVFKADNGTIREMKDSKLDLGRWVKVRLLAWDTSFQVSPGEQGKESSAFVAYSKDGITVDSVTGDEQKQWIGKPVNDYVTYLRETEEFEKAGKREFIDCQVATMGAENEPAFHEVVQITLSSTSIPAFKKYQTQLEAKAKCVAMGLPGHVLPEDPFTFYFIREGAERGNQTWTKLKIESVLPNKI